MYPTTNRHHDKSDVLIHNVYHTHAPSGTVAAPRRVFAILNAAHARTRKRWHPPRSTIPNANANANAHASSIIIIITIIIIIISSSSSSSSSGDRPSTLQGPFAGRRRRGQGTR